MLIKRIFKFSLGILTGESVVLSAGSAITSNLSPGNRQALEDFLDRAIVVTKPAFAVGSRMQLDRARSGVGPLRKLPFSAITEAEVGQCPASPHFGSNPTLQLGYGEVSMVDLVGVGLNATDTLIPLASYPDRGSKVEYRAVSVMPGGQTASTVVACQTWGLSTRYVGKLGR